MSASPRLYPSCSMARTMASGRPARLVTRIAVWVVIGLPSFADGVKGGEDLAGRALKRAVPGVMQIARLGFQFAQGVVLVDGGDDQRGIGRSVSIDRCDQRHIWDVNGVVGRN